MSELGLDIGAPSEGEGGASEGLSEEARQRFAAAAAALQQIQREEKKAKKRDDRVAQVILQFLTDDQKTHLAALIARLVSLNCPSPFILAILSIISDPCSVAVDEYLKEHLETAEHTIDAALVAEQAALDAESDKRLVEWIGRMERVLGTDSENILNALLLNATNIDGSVLQLTTFVLRDFLQEQGKEADYEHLQRLAIGVLHSLFEPFIRVREALAAETAQPTDEHL